MLQPLFLNNDTAIIRVISKQENCSSFYYRRLYLGVERNVIKELFQLNTSVIVLTDEQFKEKLKALEC